MALSDETKKKLLVGGGVGGLALLVGYFLVSGPRRADAVGPPSPVSPSGTQGVRGPATPTGQWQLPPQPFARMPANHHMKRRRDNDHDRDRDRDHDRDRCNERGEYGHKRGKHKGRNG